MEYQVGCLADMISEASGKKVPKSNKKTVAPKIKFKKLGAKKVINTSDMSHNKQGHEQEELPRKRIRFSEPIAIEPDLSTSILSHQADSQNMKRQNGRKINLAEEERTIFVGNVSNKCKKEDLRRIFASYGFIESIRFRSLSVANPAMSKKVAMIKKLLHPNRSNMNAYIRFRDVESTHKALEKNGEVLKNHTLRVDLALNKQNYNPKTCVFIGNLKFVIDEEHLRKAFKNCGEILNVRIVRDKATGMGKGIAFVEFQNSASVELALELDGKDLLGRCIRVSRLKGKDRGPKKEKKKKKQQTEGNNTKKRAKDGKQQSLKSSDDGASAGNTNTKINTKRGSKHSPKGGFANKRNKVSAGDNIKIVAKEHGALKKNKSRPVPSQFQGEKTGIKKIRKKKKTNKGELKKKVMLSKLEMIPKFNKGKVDVSKTKKSKTTKQK